MVEPARSWLGRIWSGIGTLELLLCLAVLSPRARAAESKTVADQSVATTNVSDFATRSLPPEFARRVHQRAVMDAFAAKFHLVESENEPEVLRPGAQFRVDERMVAVVRPAITAPAAAYRLGLENDQPIVPSPGFRAPILADAAELRPLRLPVAGATETERGAAGLIRQSLASDGLLITAARALEKLGPARFATNAAAGVQALADVGFPVDLLRYFRPLPGRQADSVTVVQFLTEQLAASKTPAALTTALATVPFRFVPTRPGFRAAEETGEREIGQLRLQIGGGYRDGIIRGGSIDVTGQLTAALPETDLLVSVPEEYLENIRWIALHCWPLRRPHRLTFLPEPVRFSAWAQDNGKPGFLTSGGTNVEGWATLTPRYASTEELQSVFTPIESFLLDGLRAAGQTVIQSPLLFQGGNLLVVRDPRQRQTVLLLAETEWYRNLALGLTREQILDAFRVEFGVDRCVVMPGASYHLDYDLTLRVVDGQVVAFVNDGPRAARAVVERVLNCFQSSDLMPTNAVQAALADLANGAVLPLLGRFGAALRPYLNERGQYRAPLVNLFASDNTDVPALNFQFFLASLDLLASAGLTGTNAPANPGVAEYFQALRDLVASGQAQRAKLERLGWKVVPIPSMPDLYHSINYVNCLQDRDRLLMPSQGGFYAALDEAAARAFQSALGENVKITRLLTADIQREHGGLHCVGSAYPRWDAATAAPPAPAQ